MGRQKIIDKDGVQAEIGDKHPLLVSWGAKARGNGEWQSEGQKRGAKVSGNSKGQQRVAKASGNSKGQQREATARGNRKGQKRVAQLQSKFDKTVTKACKATEAQWRESRLCHKGHRQKD